MAGPAQRATSEYRITEENHLFYIENKIDWFLVAGHRLHSIPYDAKPYSSFWKKTGKYLTLKEAEYQLDQQINGPRVHKTIGGTEALANYTKLKQGE